MQITSYKMYTNHRMGYLVLYTYHKILKHRSLQQVIVSPSVK